MLEYLRYLLRLSDAAKKQTLKSKVGEHRPSDPVLTGSDDDC